jgi:hypothetical protein
MENATFDPAAINASFDGYPLDGFMSGTFIVISRKEDSWTPHVGAAGEYARARNRNRSGTVKMTFMQTSLSNDFLSTKHAQDEASGKGTGVFQLVDSMGFTQVLGADAYVLKQAEVQFGNEILGREWTLEVPDLDMLVGGAK